MADICTKIKQKVSNFFFVSYISSELITALIEVRKVDDSKEDGSKLEDVLPEIVFNPLNLDNHHFEEEDLDEERNNKNHQNNQHIIVCRM